MSATIPTLSNKDSLEAKASALQQAGCMVIQDVADTTQRNNLVAELQTHMDNAKVRVDDDPDEFYPGLTQRVSGLVTRSETVRALMLHKEATSMCDHFLLPNSEFGYQLHVSAALNIGPGARAQVLHREEDSFTYFAEPRPNIILATMWAISDFRADNGATLVVPGSHTWPADRTPEPDEITSAEMPAGSLFFWLGGTLHGGGANTSSDWRYGVILTYSLGWVRQEENQYLNVPKHVLDTLTSEQKRIAGFDMYRALGFYDPRIQ